MIDFTARLYNLTPREAAEKLAQDFGLAYDSQAPPGGAISGKKTEAQKFREDRDHAFRVLADYYHLLSKWETDYPQNAGGKSTTPASWRQSREKIIWAICWIFFWEQSEEQKLWIAGHQSEIANLERRVKIMADKPPTGNGCRK